MMVSLEERYELIRRYRDRAWAHILKLDQERGRKLNANQIRCMNIALEIKNE